MGTRAPLLSTTTLLDQFNQGKFTDFITAVKKHVENCPNDDTSASKVIKTLASIAYKKNLPDNHIEDLVDCVVKCVVVIKNFSKLEVIKDIYNSLYHVLRRLEAQGKGELIVRLCSSYYSLLDAFENVKDVAGATFNVYVILWNLVAVSEPKLSSDNLQFLLTTIQIQNYAMKFYLATSDTDKFSIQKLVQKSKSCTKTYLAKNSSSQVFNILMENIGVILKDKTVQKDSQSSWELWLFCVETAVKRDMFEQISDIMDLKDLLVKHCAFGVKFVEFLVKLHLEANRESSAVKDINNFEEASFDGNFTSIPESYRVSLLTLFHDLLESNQTGMTRVIKSSNSRLTSVCEILLKLCSEPSLLPTAILVSKTANFFALLVISKWKEAPIDQDLVDLSYRIVKYHESCVKMLSKPDWLKYWRSSANQLTVNTYNLGALLYKALKMAEAEVHFQASCRSCVELWKFDSSKGPNPRSRYKLVSECQSKMGRHKVALVNLVTSLVYCLDEKLTRRELMERFHQYGRSWISIKKDWLKLGEAVEDEVHSTGVVSLLGEGLEVEVSVERQKRLAREEVGWHRMAYGAGLDLSASWVDSAGAVLKLSSAPADKAMVLVEQSWVFWLGDNVEDLEMAARCCEKAEKLLSGVEGVGKVYLGLALYWRYMCEHRLLQMQVIEALEKAALVPVLPERREVGDEAVDPRDVDEVVPAFAGLQMEVEDKLVDWLERAVELWEGLEGEVECDWMNSKTLLDFVSAVGWELTRLARWGLAVRVWWLLWKLGRRLGEVEHVLMAAAELVKGGVRGEVLKYLVVEGKKHEASRSHNSTAMSAGVALATVALDRGQEEEARKILEDLLQSPIIRQNSLRFNMVECEVRLLASQLRTRPGQWVDPQHSQSVNALGPMDLALEAWRQVSMCQMWWDKDIRTPGVQDPGLLVVGPRLTCLELRAKTQLVRLYNQMAAPREMRCYIKEALKTAQRNCLPLRSCELLLELAKSNLLCDDEQLALTQLAGAKFTLGDALGLEEVGAKKHRVEKVDDDKIIRLPGQSDQSMSPALIRTQQCRPSWLDHPPGCPCSHCTSPRLHSCLLQYTGLRAAALHMGGEVNEAMSSFNSTASLFEGLQVKIKAVVKKEGVSSAVGSEVQMDHLEVWYHQVECLGRDRQWEQAKVILELQKDFINALPQSHLISRPSVLIRQFDQRVAIDRAMCKKLPREKQVSEVETLLSPGVARLSLGEGLSVTPRTSLGEGQSVTPTGKSVTPTVDCRPSSSIKAPSKRDLPSLGPGETDSLAKNLDNLLIDVAEGKETPEPVKPPVKSRGRKPKLEKIIMDVEKKTPLSSSIGRKALPKLIVSEGTPTPRKFFKSKEDETPINFKAKREEPEETPLRLKAKTSTTKPKLALSPIENTSKGRSGKDPYNIFEDPDDSPKTAFKTPAPTVRASARKSATKSSAKTTTRTSSRTKSVSKPPRMASLTEEESPQRPRRTRSNRL